jgi:hypothetical protein
MGTGYTTLRPSRRGAGKDETETESDARALKANDACRHVARRDRGDVAFSQIFRIRSIRE